MEKDLLLYQRAALPTADPNAPTEYRRDENDTDDQLIVCGYCVPFTSPVNDVMLSVLAEFRRSGFSRERSVIRGRG